MSLRWPVARFTFCGLVWILLVWSATGADWEADLARFESEARTNPPPAGHVLLLGSSSFRLWTNVAEAFSGHVVVNRGFGGSHFADVLEYFERLAPTLLQPAVILIYEGDNDLAAGKAPAAVADDAKALVLRLRASFPAARLGLLTVKPSPKRAALLEVQRDLNARLAALARARRGLDLLDVATPLLDAHGQPDPAWFVDDRLHLNAAGYELWRAVLRPWVDRHADR